VRNAPHVLFYTLLSILGVVFAILLFAGCGTYIPNHTITVSLIPPSVTLGVGAYNVGGPTPTPGVK
jgi:hypothetical protein